jgi:hypothetical protein
MDYTLRITITDVEASRTMTDGSDNRDSVLKTLDEADTENAEIERKTRELLITVRHQRDLNKAFAETIKTFPDDSPVPETQWRGLRSTFDKHIVQARAIKSQLDSVPLYTTSVASNFSVVATTSSAIIESHSFASTAGGKTNWYNEKFVPRLTQLNEVMRQGIQRDQLERLIRELHLDKDQGEIKSPLVRLQEAYLALNQANTELATATSILIPLRDCIEAISSMLLPRRPTQEKTGNLRMQIDSIGEQCKQDCVEVEYFTYLGQQAMVLHQTYSQAKDKRMLREEILGHFNAGVAFIYAFLHALDPQKLK